MPPDRVTTSISRAF